MLKITDAFPMLVNYLPARELLAHIARMRGTVTIEVFTTHPDEFDGNWAVAPESFTSALSVPDGFFAVGCRITCHDYLVVMWSRDGRRFYFEGMYGSGGLLESLGRNLLAEVGQELARALSRWDLAPDQVVVARGISADDLARVPGSVDSGCLPFLLTHWPALVEHLPAGLSAVAYRSWNRYLEAHTNHAGLFKPNWEDARAFSTAPVQEGFFAIGVVSTDFEQVFVLWLREGRRFFFRDWYLQNGEQDLVPIVSSRLDMAISAWRRSRDSFVGQFGGGWLPTDLAARDPDVPSGTPWERVGLLPLLR